MTWYTYGAPTITDIRSTRLRTATLYLRRDRIDGAGESRPLLHSYTCRTCRIDCSKSVPCNICGSLEAHVLQPAQYDIAALQDTDFARTFSSSSDERLNHQLVACAHCGLQYVSPRLRAESVLEGYATGSDEQFVSQARGRELTFTRCLEVIERVWDGPPGRLLDIGTGGGSFPYMASKRGWKAEGCEPNHWLCEWARENYGLAHSSGHRVRSDTIPAKSFEVVTLWDVLEHTPDPKTEVRETHRLLKEDGLLVINYPDIGSWMARLMGRSWVFLLDVHLFYFTRATIRKLLEDAGFDVVRIRPHFQRLALGYVLQRATPYIGAPARLAERVCRRLGIGEVAGALLDGTDAGGGAQAPDDQLTRRLAFGASTMMVRASEASSRDPLLRRRISASDRSPSRSRFSGPSRSSASRTWSSRLEIDVSEDAEK